MHYSLSHEIITQARSWLGTHYHHQGRLKKSHTCNGGVDCIGFIIGVMNELNICDKNGKLLSFHDRLNYSYHPDGTQLKALMDKHLSPIDIHSRQYGDILLFTFQTMPQHVAILSPYTKEIEGIIHCTSTTGFVVEQPLSRAWERMIAGAYRLSKKMNI